MRILAFARENYPSNHPASYVLLHQSMALEDMGHEVHVYHLDRHPLGLTYYLQCFDFDLIYLDLELLRSQMLLRVLSQYRQSETVRVVGALYRLPPPPDSSWEVVDFAVSPWKGETISTLSGEFDIRYLPLAYNVRLHQRKTNLPATGGVYVGNTSGDRKPEADEYLARLIDEHSVVGVGPAFQEKYMDPFVLGRFYASSRCLPNFHYSWEKTGDCVLNERFWQTARCGVPVNDYSSLMDEVFERELVDNFCFADKRRWQDRVRELASGAEAVNPLLLEKLDHALMGHSYHDRMRQLLQWLE